MRKIIAGILLASLAAFVTWSLYHGHLDRADFTFCNGTEIQTIDPARVTGQPEGRVVAGLFEGLCRLNPEDLEPIPGNAESWTISPDGKTYTFNMRKEAKWTDGTSVTANDFEYAWRRLLHPDTASEYAFLLADRVVGAKKFNNSPESLTVSEQPKELELGTTVLVETFADVAVDQLKGLAIRQEAESPLRNRQLLKGVLREKRNVQFIYRDSSGKEPKDKPVRVTLLSVEIRDKKYDFLNATPTQLAYWQKTRLPKVSKGELKKSVIPCNWIAKEDGMPTAVLQKDGTFLFGKLLSDREDFAMMTKDGEVEIPQWFTRIGDPVEIETFDPIKGALPFAEKRKKWGVLIAADRVTAEGEKAIVVYTVARTDVKGLPQRVYYVACNAREQELGLDAYQLPDDVQMCRWFLYDFRSVGIKALDKKRLKVELNYPVPYFLTLTAFFPNMPVNRRCLETHGSPEWVKEENIVSNGAFKLQFRRLRDRVRMVKNPHYWNAKNVKLNTIDALAVESSTTQLNLYLTNQVDWITDFPSEVVTHLRNHKENPYVPRTLLGNYYYALNVEKEPLNDKRVRQALNQAIDKGSITKYVVQTAQPGSRSFVPAGMKDFGYTSPLCGEFNPENARKLLAEAGFPGGENFPRLTIKYNTLESHKAIAEYVQSQWQEHLGIDVAVRNVEWNTFLNERVSGDFEVARHGWNGDYIDPCTFLDLMVTESPQNDPNWSNVNYDELMAKAQVETDPKKRFEYFRQAEAILMEEVPVIPFFDRVSPNMVKPYVRGFYHNMLDTHQLWAISIDEEERWEENK